MFSSPKYRILTPHLDDFELAPHDPYFSYSLQVERLFIHLYTQEEEEEELDLTDTNCSTCNSTEYQTKTFHLIDALFWRFINGKPCRSYLKENIVNIIIYYRFFSNLEIPKLRKMCFLVFISHKLESLGVLFPSESFLSKVG